MTVVKALRFPVSVQADGDVLHASAPGKQPLELIGGAAERLGIEPDWSAEELLVASAAASYARTLAAVALHLGLELRVLEVSAVGHVTVREDGEYGFVAIELAVTADAGAHDPELLFKAAELARDRSRVLRALEVPVRVRVHAPASRLAQELEGALA